MLSYLLRRWRVGVVFAIFAAVALVFAWLYDRSITQLLYPLLICAAIGMVATLAGYSRQRRREKETDDFLRGLSEPPPPETEAEQSLMQAVRDLRHEATARATESDARYADLLDYYTLWAHQIKTPIASMRLVLDQQDSELARGLRRKLTDVERYVGMAMTYLRLDESANDYALRETPLDDVIRPVLRSFAGDFIAARLRLRYQPIEYTVVTDAKWLGFVIEQLLSNAIKYTPAGEIRLSMDGDELLIEDTGIGIAAEDVPRVLEKGYTGWNGRSHRKASGIGLYLCKQVCGRLGHTLTLSSEVGKGTTARIGLGQYEMKGQE